jgi:hypothetical protein
MVQFPAAAQYLTHRHMSKPRLGPPRLISNRIGGGGGGSPRKRSWRKGAIYHRLVPRLRMFADLDAAVIADVPS